jgi:hypothetical protein
MAQYQGLVSNIYENHRAEVVIVREEAGIVGAPNVNVCHSPTGSSRIRAKALNTAGAKTGDLVSLSRRSGELLKNAGILLGLPFAGLVSGTVCSLLLKVYRNGSWDFAVSMACFGLFLGIAAGVMIHRKTSKDNPLIITRVIKRGSDLSATFCTQKMGSGRQNPFRGSGCDACLGRHP